MKHVGSITSFKEQRKKDLMRAYHELIITSDKVQLMNIYEQVVNMPSKRFWVSEERAAIVIAAMAKGDKLLYMKRTKREMFQEIYRRALIVKKKYPDMTPLEISTIVVRQPAPKFYLSSDSARTYITETRKKWYEERRKKLRHLFY